MFGPQFNYLKVLSQTAKQIQHSDEYIKEGVEITAYRRIYRNVEYDDFEKQQLVAFKKALKKYNVQYNNQAQTDDILIRYLYAGSFNLSSALELFKRYLFWVSQIDLTNPSPKVKTLLEEGYIYLAGRDRQYRPTIVINAYLFDTTLFDSESFMTACYILLAICEDYMFYPGKIENVVVFVETKSCSLFNFPYKQFQIIVWMFSQNFPQILDRLYIFNPSKSLMATWEYISTLIDHRTLKKIELWKSEVFSPYAHGYDPDQVEQKFGGSMPDLTQFWIPANTIKQNTRNEPDWKYQKPLTYDRPYVYGLDSQVKSQIEQSNILPKREQQIQGQYSAYYDVNGMMENIEERDQEVFQEEEAERLANEPIPEPEDKTLHFFQPMSELFGMGELTTNPKVTPPPQKFIQPGTVRFQPNNTLPPQRPKPMETNSKTVQPKQQQQLQQQLQGSFQQQQQQQLQHQQSLHQVQSQQFSKRASMDYQNNNNNNDILDEGDYEDRLPAMSMPVPQMNNKHDDLPLISQSHVVKPFQYKGQQKDDKKPFDQSEVQACCIM